MLLFPVLDLNQQAFKLFFPISSASEKVFRDSRLIHKLFQKCSGAPIGRTLEACLYVKKHSSAKTQRGSKPEDKVVNKTETPSRLMYSEWRHPLLLEENTSKTETTGNQPSSFSTRRLELQLPMSMCSEGCGLVLLLKEAIFLHVFILWTEIFVILKFQIKCSDLSDQSIL